MLILVHRQS